MLFVAITVALAAITPLAQAASSACNPISATCPAKQALATTIVEEFKQESPWFSAYQKKDRISFTDEGLKLSIEERFDNPSYKSDFTILFGKVEAIVKSASGTGVVSSVFLQSDDLDEIDIEWFGGDAYEVQSNFFSKGNTTTFDRGGYHNMPADPRADWHNYTLDWTKDSLKWYVDGTMVRVLNSDDPQGYPQSPSHIYVGLWAGGDPGNAKGTIEWAGGETDYSKTPFEMHVKKLIVADYSSGDSYAFKDKSGSWEAVEAEDGEVNGRQEDAEEEFEVLARGGSISQPSPSPSPSPSGISSSSKDLSSSIVPTKSLSSRYESSIVPSSTVISSHITPSSLSSVSSSSHTSSSTLTSKSTSSLPFSSSSTSSQTNEMSSTVQTGGAAPGAGLLRNSLAESRAIALIWTIIPLLL